MIGHAATPPDRRLTSTRRLLGDAAMDRLWSGHAVVVGVGGVGSWAAEALARSGVGRLTLIDLDQIVESNINRQIHALESTLGAAKVDVMAQRIRQIAPLAEVRAVEQFIEPATIGDLIPLPVGVVIDAIDAVQAKAALVAWCVARAIPVVCCGAAGGRVDPLRLTCADLARTEGDSLLASVRNRLRREFGFPAGAGASRHAQVRTPPFGVAAIYSPEPMQGTAPAADEGGGAGGAPLACAGYGSIVTVTAAMGFAAASRAIDALRAR